MSTAQRYKKILTILLERPRSPIDEEVLRRIGLLYDIERRIMANNLRSDSPCATLGP